MTIKSQTLISLFLSLVLFCFCANPDETPKFVFTPGVPLADPYILNYGDTCYAYGTHADDGIEVYTSTDLTNWKKASQLALNNADTWGDRWFWAPEVYYIEKYKKFFMYYTSDEHICVATSTSPRGPFKQVTQQPMISTEKCIDVSLYIDDNGKPYVFFVRLLNTGSEVWVAELADDLMTIKTSTMKQCIAVSQPWEQVWGRVNEGPFVVKRNGTYYLSYSANSYESQLYGVGYATASSPMGPWTKSATNPILQKPGNLVGVGHHAIFTDKAGKMRIVFHAHYNQYNIHPRAMYISDITFGDGSPAPMKVTGEVIRAVIAR